MLFKSTTFGDLPTRAFSGLIFGLLAITSILSGGLVSTLFLSSCLAVMIWEVFYIFNNGKLNIYEMRSFIPALIFFVPLCHMYDFYPLLTLFMISLLSIFFKEGKWLKFFCILYIGTSVLICQELLLISRDIPAAYHLLLILAVVSGSDIGGYFFGRLIGGPKIFESVSPKKTWSGSLGGVALAVFLCMSLKPIFQYSVSEMVFLGICISVTSQAGDFFESFLKRRFKVKDSGFLLPGHGGLFDRLDGVLAAVPMYFCIILIY